MTHGVQNTYSVLVLQCVQHERLGHLFISSTTPFHFADNSSQESKKRRNGEKGWEQMRMKKSKSGKMRISEVRICRIFVRSIGLIHYVRVSRYLMHNKPNVKTELQDTYLVFTWFYVSLKSRKKKKIKMNYCLRTYQIY